MAITVFRVEESTLAYKGHPDPMWSDQQRALWQAVRAQHHAWMELEHLKSAGVPVAEECIDTAWTLYHQVEELARPYFAQEE